MRVVSVFAVVALLVLASVCSGSLLRRQMPKHAAPKAQRGQAYALVAQLVAALHYKNYTNVANLLSDDGFFIVSDIACDLLNKTQIVNAAMNEQLAASQLILGEWVETDDGVTIIKAQAGAIFGAASPLANQTYYNPNVILLAVPNADGTQLLGFERWTDSTWRQNNNASAMLHTWNTIVAADEIGDIAPWRRLVTENFTFVQHYAWAVSPPTVNNATVFLDELMHEYQRQLTSSVKVGSVFPVCDFVLGDIMAFKTTKDGRAMVQAFFIALTLDQSFNLNGLIEYAVSYY
jgi:hypothetical protein